MRNLGMGGNYSTKMIRGRFIGSKQRSLGVRRVGKVQNDLTKNLLNMVYEILLWVVGQSTTHTWGFIDSGPNYPS